jgi:serine/threonine-protein kinase
VEVYRNLQQRKRRYKDVGKRIQVLEQPQAFAHTALMPSLGKTLVIADSHSQPQFGRYQVESELGRGAMGVVYLGFDPKISRKVAIKTLDYSRYDGEELIAVKARFFREAEAAGRLRHPNIVSVYDVGEDHDLAYIAMDYVEGQPLSDFTSKKAQLPIPEVCRIIADVADALHYAHGENIVHRDIKPSNILYHRETGKVTVTDFGIARIVNEQSTQTGEILGSPLYMSPEQILGKKVDKASDIFSLGVTLFQLLGSELPFKGDNIAELSRQILQGKPVDIRDLRPGLSASVRRIITKALQKDPGDRYRDAADMASALRKAD